MPLTDQQVQWLGAALSCWTLHARKAIQNSGLKETGMKPPTQEDVHAMLGEIGKAHMLGVAATEVLENAHANDNGSVTIPGHTFRTLWRAMGKPELETEEPLFANSINDVLKARQPGETDG